MRVRVRASDYVDPQVAAQNLALLRYVAAHDPDRVVRYNATISLGLSQDPRALPYLENELYRSEREWAIEALDLHTTPEACAILVEALIQGPDDDPKIEELLNARVNRPRCYDALLTHRHTQPERIEPVLDATPEHLRTWERR